MPAITLCDFAHLYFLNVTVRCGKYRTTLFFNLDIDE